MIRFYCAKCGKKVKAPDEYAGKEAKCPECNHVNIIPEKSTPLEVEESVAPAPAYAPQPVIQQQVVVQNNMVRSDAGSIVGCYLLAMFVPLAGWLGVLYLCLKGYWIHAIVCAILSFFWSLPLLGMIVAGSMAASL